MNREQRKPLIFNIHHFALDDGPGIRTTVFLKGCPLSCIWCHNPESMDSSREIAFYPNLCIQCGDCRKICQEGAVEIHSGHRIDRERCIRCGVCAEECPSMALKVVGKYYSVDELIEELIKDRVFYETSKGGITFSGGEPALHADYLNEVLKELKKNNIHIAIQTSGMFNMAEFRTKLLPFIDLIYYDIKIYDSRKHQEYTGISNDQILDNFVQLLKGSDTAIVPRVPLVPGITATRDNLIRIADFLRGAGYSECDLLPYNSGGIEKRLSLGKTIPAGLADICINPEEEKECRTMFSHCLLDAAGSDKDIVVSRSVK